MSIEAINVFNNFFSIYIKKRRILKVFFRLLKSFIIFIMYDWFNPTGSDIRCHR